MSDHVYEARQLALWAEYKDLKGHLSHDAFMERHPRVNAYIVNLMKKFDGVSELDREIYGFDRAVWDDPMGEGHGSYDDYADAYANPKGGI
jgi:hypothetical protein